jgi:hypothetical protein
MGVSRRQQAAIVRGAAAPAKDFRLTGDHQVRAIHLTQTTDFQ